MIHQPPAGGPSTERWLDNEECMTYRKEIHANLRPKNKRERDLVDRFVDLAWYHKELDEQLAALLATPLADSNSVYSLKLAISRSLTELIRTLQQLARLQKDPILLTIPCPDQTVDALPAASTQVQ